MICCKKIVPRFVTKRQERAAKLESTFAPVNRDKDKHNNLPLGPHISPIRFSRWQCNDTMASNRRSKFLETFRFWWKGILGLKIFATLQNWISKKNRYVDRNRNSSRGWCQKRECWICPPFFCFNLFFSAFCSVFMMFIQAAAFRSRPFHHDEKRVSAWCPWLLFLPWSWFSEQ